jgi:HK97 family phage prohead protease
LAKLMVIGGYATRFNRPHAYDGGIESYRSGCFDETLVGAAVPLLLRHDFAKELAPAGSVRLWSDGTGVSFKARLPNTPLGRDTFNEVMNGRLNAMSVSTDCHIAIDRLVGDGDEWIREITSARVREISLVPKGAVPGTYAVWLQPGEALDRPFRRTAAEADADAGHCRFRQSYWGR